MSLSIGIVGLPNVGKSTLFNALTRQKVVAENYPFATINPNVGVVEVPDERLRKLAELERSKKIVPTTVEFVDIAGLVRDAHKGAGLGNQFLSHIREVDAIAEVVRFFDDPNIHHIEGKVNPLRDIDTIKTELILADLETLKKRLEKVKSDAKSGNKEMLAKASVFERVEKELSEGKLANEISLEDEEKEMVSELQLLTLKPFLYISNVISGKTNDTFQLPLEIQNNLITIDARQEEELSRLSEEEKIEYLNELGLKTSGLERLIQAAYKTLGLITFLTCGPEESRAWTVTKGSKAPQAAGKIHTDFERGFIKADVIFWQKLIGEGGWVKAREKGLVRSEGKDYIMQDGDVVIFKFNV